MTVKSLKMIACGLSFFSLLVASNGALAEDDCSSCSTRSYTVTGGVGSCEKKTCVCLQGQASKPCNGPYYNGSANGEGTCSYSDPCS